MGSIKTAVMALHGFCHKANATFPDLPTMTVTFATQEQLCRFLQTMKQEVGVCQGNFTPGAPPLPPGVDAEISGIKIKLRVR